MTENERNEITFRLDYWNDSNSFSLFNQIKWNVYYIRHKENMIMVFRYLNESGDNAFR